jgi:peptide/nickel transport system permease protein
MIPTTFGVAFVVFSLFHLAPGDPALVMMGTGGEMNQNSDGESRVDTFRREHGLDRSLPVQFFNYIGPFNFSRDGHPWFSTPYTERVTVEVELDSGETVVEGEPMPILYLPGTSDGDRESMDSHIAVIEDDEAGSEAWDSAGAALVGMGDEGLPALFTSLEEVALNLDRGGARIDRIASLLAESMEHTPQIHIDREEAIGKGALVRHWFGHYYENGGLRVQNTGEDNWGGLLMLDLGDEMQSKESVGSELLLRLKVTVPLSLISVFLSYLIALPLGIFSVRKQGTLLDGMLTVVLFVLYSIPTFWAGLMLILAFGATGLDWLPVLGLHDKDADSMGKLAWTWDLFLHSILPIATLTYGSFAYLSRQMRAGMLDVIRQDYIRTARAKGMSERVVIYKHALRNSMIPVITLLASILPILIGGSVIVEKVFNIPGMGMYAFEGLLRRDFNIIMATTLFVGVMTQFGILMSDITYSLVDPRIRNE